MLLYSQGLSAAGIAGCFSNGCIYNVLLCYRGLSAAGIAGVAIAGVLLVAIAVGVYLCIRYKNRRNRIQQGGVVIRPQPPPQRLPPQPKPMRK